MRVGRLQIAEIIAEKTLRFHGGKLADEVAAFLISERRLHDLDAIMRDVQQIRFDQGYIEATLETAHEVDISIMAAAKQTLKEMFPSAKSYVVHSSIKPSLLGGARILLPGQQLDLSLRRKVSVLKELTLS